MAFNDALAKPETIRDFHENEGLIAIPRELTDMLRKNMTMDWQQKEKTIHHAMRDQEASEEAQAPVRGP